MYGISLEGGQRWYTAHLKKEEGSCHQRIWIASRSWEVKEILSETFQKRTQLC